MRILGYARVSSDAQEQDGTSLEAQQARLVAYCKSRGWSAPTLYVEVESGGEESREKRVELDRLLASVTPGDQILVCYVDRWSRDIVFGVDSVRRLTRRGVGWIAIGDESGDEIDATTERGMHDLMERALDAEKERARIKKRTVGTRRRLRTQGFHVEGQAPLGYRVVKRRLVVDPASAAVVRSIFDLCIKGRSMREVADAIRVEFPTVRGLDFTAMARRVRDRRYLGEMNTIGARGRKAPTGVWIKTHEPLVDADTWARAQGAMDARRCRGRRPSGRSKTLCFMLRGFMRCVKCGRVVRSHVPEVGASVNHGGYYQCVAKCVRARFADVDAQAETKAFERLMQLVPQFSRVAAPLKADAPVDLDAKRATLAKRLARVLDAVELGTFSCDETRAKVEKIRAEIAAVDKQRTAPPATAAVVTVLGGAEDVRRAWMMMTPDEKRVVVGKLSDRIELESTAVRKWERGAWRLRVVWRETGRAGR